MGVLLLLLGSDACHALVDEPGWSHEEWVDWTSRQSPTGSSAANPTSTTDDTH
jgi:hypothetical protein